MKHVPLALCLVWAAPTRADTAVPQAAAKEWSQHCQLRLDQVALTVGLHQQAHYDLLRLRHEDGTPNPVVAIVFGETQGTSSISASVGEDSEPRPDKAWARTRDGQTQLYTWFRRLHGRYAKLTTDRREWTAPFKAALDECLQMGDPK